VVFRPCREALFTFNSNKTNPTIAFQNEIDIQLKVKEKSRNMTISNGVIPSENKILPVR
jgi:hypothetical protein